MNREKINFVFKIVFLLFISLVLIFSLEIFEKEMRIELISYTTEQELEDRITEILIECYSFEGAYPNKLEYLEKYGLVLNKDKYIYEYMAENSYTLPKVNVELR